MTASLIERLHRAALAAAEAERETAMKTSVRKFVRLNRDALIDLRRTAGGWRQVAEILHAEGLRWPNGKPVTADQLRSLIASTKPKPDFRGTHDGTPKPITAPPSTEAKKTETISGAEPSLQRPPTPARAGGPHRLTQTHERKTDHE